MVLVKNINRPDPESDDHFSGYCQFQWDGELFNFPMGEAVSLTPEQAYGMFLWETRPMVNARGEELPSNFRDRTSTSSSGNAGMGTHLSLYDQKLGALGWEKSPAKRKRI